jgi:hypothetical protein
VGDVTGISAIPQQIQDVGRKASGLAQEIGGIVSAGASYLEMAGSGNAGFLTTPAMAALTVAQIAALKNLGGLMDEHGRDLGGAGQVYATTEQAVVRSATPTDGTLTGQPTVQPTVQPTAQPAVQPTVTTTTRPV